MLKKTVLAWIKSYQIRGGSKIHFNIECNFDPTCSEYTYQAIERYGLFKGCLIGLKRIKKCSDPDCIEKSHDPLPSQNNEHH